MKVNRAIFESLHSPKPVNVQQGGTSCFKGNTLVVTNNGKKPISDIRIGDKVLSYNEKTGKDEFRTVTNKFRFNNSKKTIRVKLKSGETITATEDHKFYYRGGWYSLKHIVSLCKSNK